MSIYLKACVAVLLTVSSINLRATPGDLYVSDNDGIYRFAPDGTRTTVALLSRPRGLVFDNSGTLYATTLDTAFRDNQGQILKFAPNGSFTVLATANGPEGIAFHKMNGSLFVTATPPVGTFDA